MRFLAFSSLPLCLSSAGSSLAPSSRLVPTSLPPTLRLLRSVPRIDFSSPFHAPAITALFHSLHHLNAPLSCPPQLTRARRLSHSNACLIGQTVIGRPVQLRTGWSTGAGAVHGSTPYPGRQSPSAFKTQTCQPACNLGHRTHHLAPLPYPRHHQFA